MNKQLRSSLLLLLTAAIWGFAMPAQRAGSEFLSPMTFNALRTALGFLVMLPLMLHQDKKDPAPFTKKDVLAGCVAGTVLFIAAFLQQAGVSAGDSQLKVTFTIAGSSLQDHPTYKVFRDAAALLNEMGWEVEVVCDTQALTKINTGALEVWAAAWSSALDPDMYQVYHKDSTATSTLAWGYNYLKNSGSAEEMAILNDLSDLIDQARETNDRAVRADLYEQAMSQGLDLAVELPVYQRSVLYAYNSKVISSDSISEEINPYSSPLDRIWEIEFAG